MEDEKDLARELEAQIKAMAEQEGISPAELFRRRINSFPRDRDNTVDLTEEINAEINAEIDALAQKEGVTKREVFERGLKLFGVDPDTSK